MASSVGRIGSRQTMSALIGKFEEKVDECLLLFAIAAAVCAERNRLANEITADYVA
jgi:hypothetical protein